MDEPLPCFCEIGVDRRIGPFTCMERVVELCRGVQECPAGRGVVRGDKLATSGTVGDYLGELGGEMVHKFGHGFPRLSGEPA